MFITIVICFQSETIFSRGKLWKRHHFDLLFGGLLAKKLLENNYASNDCKGIVPEMWFSVWFLYNCSRHFSPSFFGFNGESKTDQQIEIIGRGQCTVLSACREFSGACFAALARKM